MYVILHGICWVVHIVFIRMVKSKFLAHFPVDHFANPGVINIIIIIIIIISSSSSSRMFYFVVDLFVHLSFYSYVFFYYSFENF